MKRLILCVAVVVVFGVGQVGGAVVVWEGGNGHAYEIVDDEVLWADARAAAELRTPPSGFQTGHLVSISDHLENGFLSDHSRPGNFWIGFTDDFVEGERTWIDGTPGIWQDPNSTV